MNAEAMLECFLARLYADRMVLEAFERDAYMTACRFGLTHEQAVSLMSIDKSDLKLAFECFAHKRVGYAAKSRRGVFYRLWRAVFRKKF